jgi:signal transduction histidine kinase
VVKPVLSLKEAVDHVVSGNYRVELQVEGKKEIVDLAKSIHNLVMHLAAVRNGMMFN